MAQATADTIRRCVAAEAHYALTETQNMKLETLRNAVSGFATLIYDGDQATARCALDVTREDMAAIFELLRDQLEALTADLPFVRPHAR